jgi:hypothetical protein
MFCGHHHDTGCMKYALVIACLFMASCETSKSAELNWKDHYREAQVECSVGDAVSGLRQTLQLPPRPDDDSLPLVQDLYRSLAVRVEAQMGASMEDSPAQIMAEAKTLRLITEMQTALSNGKRDAASDEFAAQIQQIADAVAQRDRMRAHQRERRLAVSSLAEQDRLLSAARAHDQAGGHRRSIGLYKELIASDKTGKIGQLVAAEMQRVQDKSDAVTQARSLSEQGLQSEAYNLLVRVTGKEAADQELLPWKIASSPSGARVTFSDGEERVTPFSIETTWNCSTQLTIKLDGYEPQSRTVTHPSDVTVQLRAHP